jgi:hypothetical protein
VHVSVYPDVLEGSRCTFNSDGLLIGGSNSIGVVVNPHESGFVLVYTTFAVSTLPIRAVAPENPPIPESLQKNRYAMPRNPVSGAPILAVPRLNLLCSGLFQKLNEIGN